ncbi:MAG: hypothetical protein J7M40_15200 [Planctomycetes bacterium]|nr:hypothetical protein [Planctomycetota bacterium]
MNKAVILFLIGSVIVFASSAQATDLHTTITLAADGLVDNQNEDGYWQGETEFTGSIVLGLINAYEATGNDDYKTAAELGGANILYARGGNYYGDDTYALAKLSEISDNPDNNSWRDELITFYNVRVKNGEGSTAGYLDDYASTEPSNAVFYIAHHVHAAYYVNALDKVLWRNALIDYLSEVSDSTADYPVLALGAATWALAATGPLDSTPVRTPPGGQPFWIGVTLADLPDLLQSRQVPDGEDYAGSFYWLFGETTETPKSGYTEDTVFAILGLIAVSQAGISGSYDPTILTARDILPIGVYSGGAVYEHIWLTGQQYHAFAGEMLQALGALSPAGDMDGDGDVDFVDLFNFFEHWLETPCTDPDWCSGADYNHDGIVNLLDYAIFAENWQAFTGE